MKPQISEFSYGYALTEELISTFNLKRVGSPKFPTQAEEGKKGGGFDMKLPGIPVFFQFKRSDVLKTKSAHDWRLLDLPYHRFHITASKYSQQHELLRDLEAAGNDVFYAAPRFDTTKQLDSAYVSNNVIKRSIFVAPSVIGELPDAKEHSLSFGKNGHMILGSEPRQVEQSDVAMMINQRRNLLPEILENPEFLLSQRILDSLVDIYQNRHKSEVVDGVERLRVAPEGQVSDRLEYVSRNLFGAQMLLLLP